MSSTKTQLTSRSVHAELMNAYRDLLEKIKKDLPNVDPEPVINLLRYQTNYPENIPWIRLEITYKPSTEPKAKKDKLIEKTGRCAEIRHGNVLVIDHSMTLKDLEEIARDDDVEYIVADVPPC
ncbi:MAG: hypothetical protein HMLIMOIP_000415 [Candidatus Nitrosomirales archaeon]|jgi:hypothetical protein